MSVDKDNRNIIRHFHKLQTDQHQAFSLADVQEAITSTNNSKTFQLDGLAPILLKHIEPKCLVYVTALMNICISSHKIPESSPLANLLEKLILPTKSLTWV